jgi:hypothetical protein
MAEPGPLAWASSATTALTLHRHPCRLPPQAQLNTAIQLPDPATGHPGVVAEPVRNCQTRRTVPFALFIQSIVVIWYHLARKLL